MRDQARDPASLGVGANALVIRYQNYCAVTAASEYQETDEDLVLREGLARLRYAANASAPWFVGFGTHRPHWRSRLPANWTGPEVYPGAVAPPAYPLAPIAAPYMSGNWHGGDYYVYDLRRCCYDY